MNRLQIAQLCVAAIMALGLGAATAQPVKEYPTTSPTQWQALMEKAGKAHDDFEDAKSSDNEEADPEEIFPRLVEAYDNAIDQDPSQWEPYAELGHLFVTRRDENGEITEKNFEWGLQYFEEAIAVRPGDPGPVSSASQLGQSELVQRMMVNGFHRLGDHTLRESLPRFGRLLAEHNTERKYTPFLDYVLKVKNDANARIETAGVDVPLFMPNVTSVADLAAPFKSCDRNSSKTKKHSDSDPNQATELDQEIASLEAKLAALRSQRDDAGGGGDVSLSGLRLRRGRGHLTPAGEEDGGRSDGIQYGWASPYYAHTLSPEAAKLANRALVNISNLIHRNHGNRSDCVDEEEWLDAHGRPCRDWRQVRCEDPRTASRLRYTADEMEAVLEHCPASCRVCDPGVQKSNRGGFQTNARAVFNGIYKDHWAVKWLLAHIVRSVYDFVGELQDGYRSAYFQPDGGGRRGGESKGEGGGKAGGKGGGLHGSTGRRMHHSRAALCRSAWGRAVLDIPVERLRMQTFVSSGAWINFNGAGDQNLEHVHSDTFAGVYYIASSGRNYLSSGSPSLVFSDPRGSLASTTGTLLGASDALAFGRGIAVKPVPGRIVLFPAWHMHSVPASYVHFHQDDDRGLGSRISISFNINLVAVSKARMEHEEALRNCVPDAEWIARFGNETETDDGKEVVKKKDDEAAAIGVSPSADASKEEVTGGGSRRLKAPVLPKKKKTKWCVDEEAACADWAELGECERNPVFMKASCKRACGLCGDTRTGTRA